MSVLEIIMLVVFHQQLVWCGILCNSVTLCLNCKQAFYSFDEFMSFIFFF